MLLNIYDHSLKNKQGKSYLTIFYFVKQVLKPLFWLQYDRLLPTYVLTLGTVVLLKAATKAFKAVSKMLPP